MLELTTRQEQYLGRVKRFLGEKWGGDRGITLTGARYLRDFVRERKPRLVLELGTGFSTFVLRETAIETHSVVFSADHDPVWLGFIRGLVSTEPELGQTHFYTIEGIKGRTRRRKSRFDLIFIDHGPTWQARIEDIRWAHSVLAEGGRLILDDWFPEEHRRHRLYTRPAKNQLRSLGMKLDVPADSWRTGDRKAFCVARR